MFKKRAEKKEKSLARKIVEGVFLGIFVALILFSSVSMIVNSVNSKKSENPNAPIAIGDSYLPVVVISDSMEPEYPIKSAIFVKKVSCQEIANNFVNKEDRQEGEEPKVYDLTFFDHISTSAFYEKYDSNYEYTEKIRDIDLKNYYPTDPTNKTMTHRLFRVEVVEEREYGKGRYLFFVSGINEESKNYDPIQYQVFTENELYGAVVGCSKFVGGFFYFMNTPLGLIVLLLIPSLYMIISSFIDIFKKEPEESVEGETKVVDPNDPLSGISDKEKERLKKELLESMLEGDDK